MGQAGAEVVTIGRDEDLSLVHEAAESLGVDDAIPVALEFVADSVGWFGPYSAGALLTGPGVRALAQFAGFRSSHERRLGSEIRSVLPGACARTWARTTRRMLSPDPFPDGVSRIGFSIMALSCPSVPGGIGKASVVADRQSGQSTPPKAGAK